MPRNAALEATARAIYYTVQNDRDEDSWKALGGAWKHSYHCNAVAATAALAVIAEAEGASEAAAWLNSKVRP